MATDYPRDKASSWTKLHPTLDRLYNKVWGKERLLGCCRWLHWFFKYLLPTFEKVIVEEQFNFRDPNIQNLLLKDFRSEVADALREEWNQDTTNTHKWKKFKLSGFRAVNVCFWFPVSQSHLLSALWQAWVAAHKSRARRRFSHCVSSPWYQRFKGACKKISLFCPFIQAVPFLGVEPFAQISICCGKNRKTTCCGFVEMFSKHPSTGNVCVPLDPSTIDHFQLSSVPKLAAIMAQVKPWIWFSHFFLLRFFLFVFSLMLVAPLTWILAFRNFVVCFWILWKLQIAANVSRRNSSDKTQIWIFDEIELFFDEFESIVLLVLIFDETEPFFHLCLFSDSIASFSEHVERRRYKPTNWSTNEKAKTRHTFFHSPVRTIEMVSPPQTDFWQQKARRIERRVCVAKPCAKQFRVPAPAAHWAMSPLPFSAFRQSHRRELRQPRAMKPSHIPDTRTKREQPPVWRKENDTISDIDRSTPANRALRQHVRNNTKNHTSQNNKNNNSSIRILLLSTFAFEANVVVSFFRDHVALRSKSSNSLQNESEPTNEQKQCQIVTFSSCSVSRFRRTSKTSLSTFSHMSRACNQYIKKKKNKPKPLSISPFPANWHHRPQDCTIWCCGKFWRNLPETRQRTNSAICRRARAPASPTPDPKQNRGSQETLETQEWKKKQNKTWKNLRDHLFWIDGIVEGTKSTRVQNSIANVAQNLLNMRAEAWNQTLLTSFHSKIASASNSFGAFGADGGGAAICGATTAFSTGRSRSNTPPRSATHIQHKFNHDGLCLLSHQIPNPTPRQSLSLHFPCQTCDRWQMHIETRKTTPMRSHSTHSEELPQNLPISPNWQIPAPKWAHRLAIAPTRTRTAIESNLTRFRTTHSHRPSNLQQTNEFEETS